MRNGSPIGSEAAMSTQRPASNIAIRPCTEADIAAITGIYAHHVLHGLASFELEPPSEKELRQRYFDISGAAFPISWPSVRVRSWVTPMRHPTAQGRLIATLRKTLFTCTRLGPVGVSVDS